MRVQLVLLPLLTGLLGNVVAQSTDVAATTAAEPSATDNSPTDEATTTDAQPTTTDAPSTTEDNNDSTTSQDNNDSTTSDEPTSDVTTTVTTTVAGADGSTTTEYKTTTSVTTIIITSTRFATTTVTSSNAQTATTTVYETTTVMSEEKRRWVDEAEATGPAEAAAHTTADLPEPTDLPDQDMEMVKRVNANEEHVHLAKRATRTVVRTVTGENGDDVTKTSTRTAVSTTTGRTTITSTITQTDQVDASTTETVTSTLTVTSASVSTGVTQPTETSSSDNSSDSSGSSGGLSNGAKIGIGVGVGVGGLAVIAALGWFCFRRRRSGPKPNHDDLSGFGASEVPVGAAAAGAGAGAAAGAAADRRTPPMSHTPSSATAGGYTQEGYRGTAMGDGRAGYAKPETYGGAYTRQSAYNKSVSPATAYSHPTGRSNTLGSTGEQLPAEMDSAVSEGRQPTPQAVELGSEGHTAKWSNPGAAEIDGTQALNQRDGPVFEMPAQNYR